MTQLTSRYVFLYCRLTLSIIVSVVAYTYYSLPSLQVQVSEGIDAVIVDSVLAIRQGLTGVEA